MTELDEFILMLIKAGLIPPKYSGQLIINLHLGDPKDILRKERILKIK